MYFWLSNLEWQNKQKVDHCDLCTMEVTSVFNTWEVQFIIHGIKFIRVLYWGDNTLEGLHLRPNILRHHLTQKLSLNIKYNTSQTKNKHNTCKLHFLVPLKPNFSVFLLESSFAKEPYSLQWPLKAYLSFYQQNGSKHISRTSLSTSCHKQPKIPQWNPTQYLDKTITFQNDLHHLYLLHSCHLVPRKLLAMEEAHKVVGYLHK